MRILIAAALVLATATAASAQTACGGGLSAAHAAADSTAASVDAHPARADSSAAGPVAVRSLAAATAGEVRFNAQPRLRVALCGSVDSVHLLARRNLPTPVVTGTTYRNVYVAVEIFGRLNADCIARGITGTGTVAGAGAGEPRMDCASLHISGASTSTKATPPDTTRAPRR
jgi:hypothetical protein